MTKVENTCLYCKKMFYAKSSPSREGRGKYCSKDCHDAARRNRTTFKCLVCGISFDKTQSQVASGQGKYCSKRCSEKASDKRIERSCLECGIKFLARYSRVKNGDDNYCCKKCRGIASRKRVKCVCLVCQAPFEVWKSQYDKGGGKFCSRICQGKHNSKNRTGANHPAWQGGKVNYRGENWPIQRRLAYHRDNGICQYCQHKPKKGERKNSVHHIKPFREFNGDYVAANDLSNLVTLCLICHRKAECGKIAVPVHLL